MSADIGRRVDARRFEDDGLLIYTRSAPTGAIHWAAAICRRPRAHADARRTDANRGSSDRPWAQHNAGPYDAASRITNIRAVNHGIGRLRTHRNSGNCCQRNTGTGPPDEPRHDYFLRLPSVQLIE
jgi:hypothetical protein